MYLEQKQKDLCVEIAQNQIRSIADFVTRHLPGKDSQAPNSIGLATFTPKDKIYALAYQETEKVEIVSSVRTFISLWYVLERHDLVRSIDVNPKINVGTLFTQGQNEPDNELMYECSDYLDKKLVPLSEFYDFVQGWVTHAEKNEQDVLQTAHRANLIAFVIGVVSILANAVTILITFLKN
jgi:hypothetical protein